MFLLCAYKDMTKCALKVACVAIEQVAVTFRLLHN